MNDDGLTQFRKPEYPLNMATKMISTIEDLVRELGGSRRVASMCNVTQQAVCNWVAEGHIGNGHHLKLFLEAWARGLLVDPEVFELDEPSARFFAAVLRSSGKRPETLVAI